MNLDTINNDYVAAITSLFVALYGLALGRVELPNYLKNLFTNNIFRTIFLALLVIYGFGKAPHVGFSVALIFIITMYHLEKQEIKENFYYLDTLIDVKKYRN